MGLKDEIREAKELAAQQQKAGNSLPNIAEGLNVRHQGFYYVSQGHIYRENVPDYAPPVVII